MSDRLIDLEALALRSGQGACVDLDVSPEPPSLGGERLTLETDPVRLKIDVSRTTSGFALRMRGEAVLVGACARCLGPARLVLEIEAREVDQMTADPDGELKSPYVADELLDPEAWLRDAIALGLPERLLCRPDCAGLCEICGVSLNDIDPAEHVHERPPDPRFAKLRDLQK